MKLNQTVVRYVVVFALFTDAKCQKPLKRIAPYTHHWETATRARQEAKRCGPYSGYETMYWRKGIHIERVEMHI